MSYFYFTKPLESVLREKRGDEDFYYLALMKKAPEIAGSAGHRRHFYSFNDKKKIDRMPKYLRRGGEYGHDPVIMYSRDDDKPKQTNDETTYANHQVKLCKIYGLQIAYRPAPPKTSRKSSTNLRLK